ncbi:CGNR zinc finger domain-containing protein [Psychromicrobium xiongbiense]|uniref:CGNR zinc finger domain-containing protein n=1 Tax=Psychromicrobium xiongbiense TaxID=3051184 RepID=UPI00255503CE|nr:CGNR zinc finger domain-containing protein [Psychromicrobium sp. YIM S02556]
MIFTPDTELALNSAVALINTGATKAGVRTELLGTVAELDAFVDQEKFSGSRTHDAAELAGVQKVRSRLTALWGAEEDVVVAETNAILREASALPQLVRHDGFDWHLHATAPEADLGVRMAVEAAMALADVIRSGELGRLRRCAAEDCTAVVVDLSKNRSRRFCATGNCGNKTHVAAYRARKAATEAF